MKRVLVITSGKDKTRISTFTRNYINNKKIPCDLKYFKDVFYHVKDGEIELSIGSHKLTDYSYIYFRMTKKEIYKELAAIISDLAASNKIGFFDKVYQSLYLNTKLLQTYYFAKNGIGQPETIYAGALNDPKIRRIIKALDFPIIAKKSSAQRGESMFLLKTEKQFQRFSKRKDIVEYIYQRFIPNTYDWRLYVVDKEVILSEKRVRGEKEFRNNIALGATKLITDSPKKVNALAVKAAKAVNITFAGVDIIDSEGKLYVLEANRAPAFKAYGTKKNKIKGLPEYIISKLK
jgi:glutathione synthase/RimK-type ligase-like ATP-grasp enzyme